MAFFIPSNTFLGVVKLHIFRRKKLDNLGGRLNFTFSEEHCLYIFRN
jgi:hypothetical protein